jgi:hypothetical protein
MCIKYHTSDSASMSMTLWPMALIIIPTNWHIVDKEFTSRVAVSCKEEHFFYSDTFWEAVSEFTEDRRGKNKFRIHLPLTQ